MEENRPPREPEFTSLPHSLYVTHRSSQSESQVIVRGAAAIYHAEFPGSITLFDGSIFNNPASHIEITTHLSPQKARSFEAMVPLKQVFALDDEFRTKHLDRLCPSGGYNVTDLSDILLSRDKNSSHIEATTLGSNTIDVEYVTDKNEAILMISSTEDQNSSMVGDHEQSQEELYRQNFTDFIKTFLFVMDSLTATANRKKFNHYSLPRYFELRPEFPTTDQLNPALGHAPAVGSEKDIEEFSSSMIRTYLRNIPGLPSQQENLSSHPGLSQNARQSLITAANMYLKDYESNVIGRPECIVMSGQDETEHKSISRSFANSIRAEHEVVSIAPLAELTYGQLKVQAANIFNNLALVEAPKVLFLEGFNAFYAKKSNMTTAVNIILDEISEMARQTGAITFISAPGNHFIFNELKRSNPPLLVKVPQPNFDQLRDIISDEIAKNIVRDSLSHEGEYFRMSPSVLKISEIALLCSGRSATDMRRIITLSRKIEADNRKNGAGIRRPRPVCTDDVKKAYDLYRPGEQ